MREIKFRAWDKILSCYSKNSIDMGYSLDGTFYPLSGNRYILEQFTGLHDKNGKEIYEGDILQNNAGEHAPVIYRCGGFFVELVDCEEFGTMYVPLNEAILLVNLVGNIHENPELLNVH